MDSNKNKKNYSDNGKKLWVRIVVLIVAVTVILGFVVLPLASYAEEDKSSIVVSEFETGKLADALNKAMDGTDFNYITNVAVMGGTLNSDDYQALKNIPNIENLELAKAETEDGVIPANALDSRNKLTYVSLPKNTVEISDKAFSCNRLLKKVSLPNTVKTIGNYAFESCIVLEKIDMPIGVTDIGEGAFTDCKALTSFTIPENVSLIPANAFSKCGLTEMYIGPNVTVIGNSAFADCHELKDIYFYGKTAPVIAPNDAFQNLSVTLHCSADAEGYEELKKESNFIAGVEADFEEEYVAPKAPETEAVYKEEDSAEETTVTEKAEETTAQITEAVPASVDADKDSSNGLGSIAIVVCLIAVGICIGAAIMFLIIKLKK